MHAPLGESAGERMVETARMASSLDLSIALYEAGIRKVVLVTDDDSFAQQIGTSGLSVAIENSSSPFHFGKMLQHIISKYSIDGLLYFGSGSGVFLDADRVKFLVAFTQRKETGALFNNFYSCDFAAVAQSKSLLSLDLPDIDNSFGFALSDAGISCNCLSRELSTQYDIDTPTDVLLLAATGLGGEKLSLFTQTINHYQQDIPQVLNLIRSRDAQLVIIGRVNPITWGHFESETACRTNVLSEGRGMRAYPSTRTMLTKKLLAEGAASSFFKDLSSACDGAIIDTRPLLAREGGLPPASDRFASDLRDYMVIQDPLWREFTLAASKATIPVILGGHSLVSGGLYLLPEASWKDHHFPRRLHPDTIDWQKEQT